MVAELVKYEYFNILKCFQANMLDLIPFVIIFQHRDNDWYTATGDGIAGLTEPIIMRVGCWYVNGEYFKQDTLRK